MLCECVSKAVRTRYLVTTVPGAWYSPTCSKFRRVAEAVIIPTIITTYNYTRLTLTVFTLFLAFSSPSPIDLRVSSSILDCSVLFLAAPAPPSSELKLTLCAPTGDGRMPLSHPSEPFPLKRDWRITLGMDGILPSRFRLASWWRWQQDSTIVLEGGIRCARE